MAHRFYTPVLAFTTAQGDKTCFQVEQKAAKFFQIKQSSANLLAQPSSGRGFECFVGHALIMALNSVARGMAKNTPQNPQIPPKTSTAIIIATGWRFTCLLYTSDAADD